MSTVVFYKGGAIMFHKVREIKPIREYVLLATFHDDTVKTYDIEPLFAEIEVFNTLKTNLIPHLFEQLNK